jgi:ADP-ribosylation factor GTPase-activating protein 1
MVDSRGAEFFRGQQDDPSNTFCCDSGSAEAVWASVSYGIYLSIGASGVHRSLGVKTSFVLSTTMDSWKPVHLRMMELGGNRRFQEFLEEQGVPEDMAIRRKYNTLAAKWYRENLRALAEGTTPPEPLLPGTGHLLVAGACSAEQALLDDVFAAAPKGGMTAGGVPASCSRIARESSKGDESPRLVALAMGLHRAFQGHRTAMRLKSESSKNMVGFGPETCCAAASEAEGAQRRGLKVDGRMLAAAAGA